MDLFVRLFLSMDPRHGEISRAMRNRGVEIYVPGEVGKTSQVSYFHKKF